MNAVGVRTRQQEVLEILYRLGEASVADVRRELAEDLDYSAVRSALNALEAKELVKHRERNLRYVYSPVVPRSRASRAAVRRLLVTYFDDDPVPALKALLEIIRKRRAVDYAAMRRLVDEARKKRG